MWVVVEEGVTGRLATCRLTSRDPYDDLAEARQDRDAMRRDWPDAQFEVYELRKVG